MKNGNIDEKQKDVSEQKQERVFLASPAQLSAALEAAVAADGPGFIYLCSANITPQMWDAAHAIGLARTLIKKLRGQKAHENRGEDDERIDTEGALAELIAATAVAEKIGATVAPLVAHKPSGDTDITWRENKLDVKCAGQGRICACINVQAHSRKVPRVYIIVHLVRADIADIYAVPGAHVPQAWRYVSTMRGAALPPGRHYYMHKMPAIPLPAADCEQDIVDK